MYWCLPRKICSISGSSFFRRTKQMNQIPKCQSSIMLTLLPLSHQFSFITSLKDNKFQPIDFCRTVHAFFLEWETSLNTLLFAFLKCLRKPFWPRKGREYSSIILKSKHLRNKKQNDPTTFCEIWNGLEIEIDLTIFVSVFYVYFFHYFFSGCQVFQFL